MRRPALIASLFALSMVTYIDRAAISSAKGAMAGDLRLDDSAMGAIFGAFALGYALAQVPAGWIADRFGPRAALSGLVILWSLLTGLTGAARGFAGLLIVRFVFGVAEAGAFPGAARAIANWLEPGHRGFANGIMFSGSRLGAAFAFPLMAGLISWRGWQVAFFALMIPGVLWAAGWWLWFRDYPSSGAASDSRHYHAVPSMADFRRVLASRDLALAMVQYFAGNFTFFICLSWMHPYLKQQYQLGDEGAARYAMMPLVAGAFAQWFAGFLVDRIYHSRFRTWSRRGPAIVGFVLAAGGMLALTRASSVDSAVLWFTIATFGSDMTISPSWAFCVDIGKGNAGAVSGSMNMIGNIGSFVSANAFPYLHGLTGSAQAYFAAASLLNFVSILCWLAMRGLSPLVDKAENRPLQ